MGAANSPDLRNRILPAYDSAMTTKQIAKLYDVSPAWARRPSSVVNVWYKPHELVQKRVAILLHPVDLTPKQSRRRAGRASMSKSVHRRISKQRSPRSRERSPDHHESDSREGFARIERIPLLP